MLNLQKISEILAAAKSGSKEYHPVSFPKTFFTQMLMAMHSKEQERFSFLTHGGIVTGTWNALGYEENTSDFLILHDVELTHHGKVCHQPHFLLFVEEIIGFSLPE